MSGLVARLRAIAYRIAFVAGSVPILLLVPIVALFGRRAMIPHAHGWARYNRWATRVFLGVTSRIEGVNPAGSATAGPVLYAAKHEAMFETTELAFSLDAPIVVLKRELSEIPLWGWATRVYGSIAVDREASAAALRRMIAEAGAAKREGRSVIVYPEGTRVPHGEAPPLRSGFAGLYKALGYPVVPIAVDSGAFIPRHGLGRPGVVTIRIGDPIPPGLPRREVEARVHAAINALNGLRAGTGHIALPDGTVEG